MPRSRSTSAIRGAAASSPTPIRPRVAPAGLVSGPSRLNAVRTPISRRVGPAWRIAGWNDGANRNAKPSSRIARPAESASWSIRMPSASSTSAEPDLEVIARLPCLATGTPQDATTSAAVVEMLNVPEPSPPVPTMSIVPSGASTRTTRSRIADAKPASSSTVSPRIRRPMSRAASCDGVASPSITAPIARRASSIESVRPSTIAASAARTWSLIGRPRRRVVAAAAGRVGHRPPSSSPFGHPARREGAGRVVEARGLPLPGEPEEVREQVRAVRREHGLGVELDALDGQRAVAEAHDDAVVRAGGGHVEVLGKGGGVDAQGVVAGGREVLPACRRGGPRPSWATLEASPWTSVGARTIGGAPGGGHRLHAEADAEQRDPRAPRRPGSWPRDTPAVPGLPGPGETTMPRRSCGGVGGHGLHALAGDLVVADHADVRAGGLERLDQVEREAVVVVDHQDHGRAPPPAGAPRPAARARSPGWAPSSACAAGAGRRGRGGQLDRPAQGRGLVLGLLELGLRHAPGHDPGARVDVRLAALEHGAADRDRGVQVAVVAEVAHGATIQAAALALGRRDQLHRADLGGAGERAGREHGAQRVQGVQLRAEARLHVAHQVEDVAVALHLHVLAGGHGAGPGDAPEVVAPEVHEHHVLRALLGVPAQLVGEAVVVGGGGAARPGAGDGVRRHPVADDLEEELRAGAHHLEATGSG